MALERGDVGFVLGLAGFLLGGIGAFLGYRTVSVETRLEQYHEVLTQDGESIEAVLARVGAIERALGGVAGQSPISPDDVAKLRGDLADANKRVSAAARDIGFQHDEIAALRAQLSQLEQKLPK